MGRYVKAFLVWSLAYTLGAISVVLTYIVSGLADLNLWMLNRSMELSDAADVLYEQADEHDSKEWNG